MNKKCKKQKKINEEISRRDFLKVTGTIIIGAGLGSCVVPGSTTPASDGYLLVDSKKCQGCVSCMLACSLVHEGVESLSLSRIQVLQNAFANWPGTSTTVQCRQCVDPPCVKVCPTGALQANAAFGNVRMVDSYKCIGCGKCVHACPYTPSRVVLAPDAAYGNQEKSRKCDLCADTPFHWDKAGGGPDGKKACVEVCPVGAIKFTKEVPVQEGNSGYDVNLRGGGWKELGYPTE